MTKHDLKEMRNLGAELGAAKAENDRLRGLLRDVNDVFEGQHPAPGLVIDRVRNTLAQQAEPTDTYTAVDMATAAAQGFRDGQAAVEPAPAQDERDSLAERMRAAGMLTVDEMLSGAPLDRFIRHAGVNDLDTYGQWLEMKCREFLSMQASRELEKREDDDLYEWVLAHAAAFQEARINFNAARPAQTAPRCQCCGYLVTESEHRGCLRAAAPSLSAVTAERDAFREGRNCLVEENTLLYEQIADLIEDRDQLQAEVERYVPLHEAVQRAAGLPARVGGEDLHVPVIPFMRPVTEPPPAGKPIQLFLKDGRTRAATTSLVFMGNECFFMWYDAQTRKSIAVDKIKGWAPAQLA